ncbi:hypothetical protein BGZ83_004687 [Gryganskiella cystojenkinii]|nr:hypothetical protein BGZ83_004687 [Gryganskiella cystojenkinii]
MQSLSPTQINSSLLPAIKVFAIQELAHLILNDLSKSSILDLRETCRVLHNACTTPHYFYKNVTRPTDYYLHHKKLGGDSITMNPYWIRSLGLNETEPTFGMKTSEIPYFRRALQEWPNLVSLRMAIQWLYSPKRLEDTIVSALKLKSISALYSSLAKNQKDYDNLLLPSEIPTFSTTTIGSTPSSSKEIFTATLLATGMTTRLQRDHSPEMGTMKGLNHLELFFSLMSPIDTDFGSLLEKFVSCTIPMPVASWLSTTSALNAATATVPIFSDLVSLKFTLDLRRVTATIPWSSLLKFLDRATPVLQELDLGSCLVQVNKGEPIDMKEPTIQHVQSLALKSKISRDLAKRLIRSFPNLISLSIHDPEELWEQRPVVLTNDNSASPVFIITEETRAAEKAAMEAATTWTPFPKLKRLHMSLVSQPPFFTTLNPNWTLPKGLEELEHPFAHMTAACRSITKAVLSIEQSEGQGARVRRSIGRPELRNHDPFLMLDTVDTGAPYHKDQT